LKELGGEKNAAPSSSILLNLDLKLTELKTSFLLFRSFDDDFSKIGKEIKCGRSRLLYAPPFSDLYKEEDYEGYDYEGY